MNETGRTAFNLRLSSARGGRGIYTQSMFLSPKQYYVYILTNYKKTVLYTGVTNNLVQRIIEHYLGRGNAKSSQAHTTHSIFCIMNATSMSIMQLQEKKKLRSGIERRIDQFIQSGLEISEL